MATIYRNHRIDDRPSIQNDLKVIQKSQHFIFGIFNVTMCKLFLLQISTINQLHVYSSIITVIIYDADMVNFMACISPTDKSISTNIINLRSKKVLKKKKREQKASNAVLLKSNRWFDFCSFFLCFAITVD